MPSSQHVHHMAVVAWSFRNDPDNDFPPAVLLGCDGGVCAKTEVYKAKPRLRRVPEGLTPEQFHAMQGGAYWNEICTSA